MITNSFTQKILLSYLKEYTFISSPSGNSHTYAHIRIHAHARAYTRTHLHIRTYTHAPLQTDPPAPSASPMFFLSFWTKENLLSIRRVGRLIFLRKITLPVVLKIIFTFKKERKKERNNIYINIYITKKERKKERKSP